ncbi:N-acetylglucosaminyl-diphospho-decaprenol L-rhamnosyltransferase [Nakamurella panacisegetis]|uniref:N-acetylglucosaminyl-diphospho-decaprenol L-rhamnosyltransferase n=1 Tax=Nakamurella panacisegetis TaxID=1090615 RepID=A0A1H0PH09_9ACTN|nr:glycosyltransferase family 2 protein [Nakamurella panacisegetis]SDP04351.1 N-acetylglucosaminyl-diphospho-decaprenol L-rhamnosyltransferase [Nakamurella panacisegetis]
MTALLGIVVVTYSPGETLAAFLDSVPAAYAGPTDIVLADNGSTDGSVEQAAERPGVRLLRTGGNLGFGTGANRGAAVIDPKADFLLVVNPDVVLHPGSIDVLLEAAVRHPEAGALGPAIVTPDGTLYPSARRLPTIALGAGHAVLGWGWPKNPWTRAYRAENSGVHERVAGWLSGSCLLLRRSAFEQIDGFDEHYFMYFEDVDLGRRLSEAGWTSVYVPDAVVTHIGGHAAERAGSAMVVEHHRSAYRYLAARHPAWWQLPIRVGLRVALKARQVIAVRSGKVSAGARLDGRRLGDE